MRSSGMPEEKEGQRSRRRCVNGCAPNSGVDNAAGEDVGVQDVDVLISVVRMLRTARLRQLGAARRLRRDA